MIWLLGCAQTLHFEYGVKSDTGSDVQIEIRDADGDGFPDWSTASSVEEADCDDQDPDVTPENERWIEAGYFWRGDDEAPLAGPMREVFVSGFCIDRNEVQNDEYAVFMTEMWDRGLENQDEEGVLLYDFEDNDDIYEPTIEETANGYRAVSGRGAHPVTEVWFLSAQRFCQEYGKVLPTEAQWEKAARGTDQRRYPWGNEDPTCELANFGTPQERCEGDTLPVGSHPLGASPYGVLDMAGNVSEWVYDFFQEDYYEVGDVEDPQGPMSGYYEDETGQGFEARIARSGNHSTGEGSMQAFHRTPEPAFGSSNGLGFRCVRILE